MATQALCCMTVPPACIEGRLRKCQFVQLQTLPLAASTVDML